MHRRGRDAATAVAPRRVRVKLQLKPSLDPVLRVVTSREQTASKPNGNQCIESPDACLPYQLGSLR